MNYIHTLFSRHPDTVNHKFGWVSSEYHLMGWALSCLQVKTVYDRVDLHCNSIVAGLLVDTLHLPYTNVHTTHDNLTLIHDDLWAIPKIYTYSLQKDPFIHLDGDVFVFNELPKSFLKSELVAQNIEQASDFYFSAQKQIMEHLTYLPDCVCSDFNNPYPIKAVNAGIIGGNNIDFIKEYSQLAFKYINDTFSNLRQISVDGFNVFFEQHLFYSLAKQREYLMRRYAMLAQSR